MSDKPIVLQTTSVHPVFDTRIFVKECQALAEAGYRVVLIAQHDKKEIVQGIEIDPLPKVSDKKGRFKRIIPRLVSKVLSYPKGSVVHFHDPELILVGIYLKMKGYKVIYDIHEHTPMDFYTKEWLPKWLRPFLTMIVYMLEYIAGLVFDGIVTVVEPVTKRFRHARARNVEISNYPKLDALYETVLKRDHVRKDQAIYVGGFTYRRGIDVMVKAIGKTEHEKNIRLKLGGKFDPPEIREDIEQLDGWEKCDYLGWLSMEEIWTNLAESKVGIVTIQDVPSHRLLESVKMFEYMAMGLPVIASDFPMFRAIIEPNECGIMVDPGSPEEIAAAIEWIFDHPKEAREMGEKGRKAVQEYYRWENEAAELIQFYKALRC